MGDSFDEAIARENHLRTAPYHKRSSADTPTAALVKRLKAKVHGGYPDTDAREAAAEIERLQAALEQISEGETVPMWARMLAKEALSDD